MSEPQQQGPNALWAAVIGWAAAIGEKNINQRPGLWKRRADKRGLLGPFDVKINPHKIETENLPPFGVTIGNDEFFPGVVALVTPGGGAALVSNRPGEDEEGLIKFFTDAAHELTIHGKRDEPLTPSHDRTPNENSPWRQ